MSEVRRTDGARSPNSTAQPIGPVLRYLERQSAAGFFGVISISIQNGRVCSVRTEQTFKPDEL